eukprot:PhF_6_TR6990/c2_g1_i2/m.10366
MHHASTFKLIAAAYLLYRLYRSRANYIRQRDVTNDTTFFSQSYLQARERFRAAAKAAGAELTSLAVCTDAITGLALTTEVAVLKGTNPKKLFVHISGTHGAEGYAGSAIQIQWLQQHALALRRAGGKASAVMTVPTLVIVHALNPYGMHCFRRYNENNVDLNRNCLTAAQFLEKTTQEPNKHGYETVSGVLNPPAPWTWLQEMFSIPKFVYYVLRYGYLKLASAIVVGQYHNARGVMYGGTSLQPSHANLMKFLEPFAAEATDEVVLVDVHSGLGPSGVDTLMVDDKGAKERVLAIAPLHDKRFIESPSESGPAGGGMYKYMQGAVTQGYPSITFPKSKKCTAVTEEFGTVPSFFVMQANIRENAAWVHAPGTQLHRLAAEQLLGVFYVQESQWKASVLLRGGILMKQVLDYLSK